MTWGPAPPWVPRGVAAWSTSTQNSHCPLILCSQESHSVGTEAREWGWGCLLGKAGAGFRKVQGGAGLQPWGPAVGIRAH